MALVTEQAAFLLDVCQLVQWATGQGYVITGGELWRTPEQQELYVRAGRSKTYNSFHLRRLAIDLNIFGPDKRPLTDYADIKPIGDHWESLNPKNVWGGHWKSFKDLPHFERRV